ncbi:putative triacylglycerol lipase [Aspergillus steynii IBT 23096]|uniref:Putative triacylglycerol lipase n=1 Tax=Aspergillus steynii IBT 23096 TaxID=1392250 RepID=A0A2I2G9Q2_9EURO|nr:putative triacylglycerol lipase [Aspergillus steynii IBT 23096]PLB49604.1 putative triacylglycerol lipase [Aspergillus steynii IBT 23096]
MVARLRPSAKYLNSPLGLQFTPTARSHARHFRSSTRGCGSSEQTRTYGHDPRLESLGKVIKDEYAVVRDSYDTPKHPIVLAHGLLGFDELRLAGPYLPGVQYWRGIKEALSMKGVQVITATVPPSGSIEMRAEELARDISVGARGKDVNIIAGLDSRHMISHLKPKDFNVKSLTTIATPHRGSSVADYVMKQIGDDRLAQLYYALGLMKVETGAFSQLTREYMEETFNPATPDVDDVRYFSYGASMQPSFWSVFRLSHRILEQIEGFNDGLVSVASSRWGGEAGYKGTLLDVSHLDLINWSNRLKWLAGEITGNRRRFNAIALYLDIADMLAKEGL